MPDTEGQRLEEAAQSVDATTADLGERSERLGEDIEQAKRQQEQTMADESVPTAAGDWEDTEPEDSTGEDPAGFDDPEDLDLEDLDDEDAGGDDDAAA
jgi:phage shock protein A